MSADHAIPGTLVKSTHPEGDARSIPAPIVDSGENLAQQLDVFIERLRSIAATHDGYQEPPVDEVAQAVGCLLERFESFHRQAATISELLSRVERSLRG